MKYKNPAFLAVLSALAINGAGLTMPAQAFAASYSPTHIYLNGTDVTNPSHTAATDPSSGQATTFMPIYYAGVVLNQLGITNTWDGQTWALTTPSGMSANLGTPSTSTNQMNISLNGTIVQTAPKVVAVDPSSGQQTTFIPIFYLSQVLSRLGVESTWDGTNWRLTKITPETQQAMANSMWQVFNATKYDVDHYASMQEANVSPTTDSVTAGDVSNWLLQWASKSKGYKDSVYAGGAYHPFSLTSETSNDPFTWTLQNGLWNGTSIASSSTVLSQSDVSKVISNLTWWLNGYKVQNGIYTLHVPFADHYPLWHGACVLNPYPTSEYQAGMADDTYYYDQIQVWSTDGWKTVHVKLPSTVGSSGKVTLGVNGDHGAFNYGNFTGNGSQVNSSDEGGLTLTFSNPSDAPGFATAVSAEGVISENENAGIELDTIYRNVNGVPDINNPVDEAAGQE